MQELKVETVQKHLTSMSKPLLEKLDTFDLKEIEILLKFCYSDGFWNGFDHYENNCVLKSKKDPAST